MRTITKLTVTFEDGSTETYEATGYVQVTSAQVKTPGMAKIVGTQVVASVMVPKEDS